MESQSTPSTMNRLGTLVSGPLYLLMLAMGASNARGFPSAYTLLATVLGALAIMAAFAALGLRAYARRDDAFRFSLSTAFICSIPLCIYLAAVRWVMSGVKTPEFHWAEWGAIGLICVGWMWFTSGVLAQLAEALMWLAVWVLRRFRNR
jgi:hypothetical protein